MTGSSGCGLAVGLVMLFILCVGLHAMASVGGPGPLTWSLEAAMGVLAVGIAAAAFATRGEWSPGLLHKPCRGKPRTSREPWPVAAKAGGAGSILLASASGLVLVFSWPWISPWETGPLIGGTLLVAAAAAGAFAIWSAVASGDTA